MATSWFQAAGEPGTQPPHEIDDKKFNGFDLIAGEIGEIFLAERFPVGGIIEDLDEGRGIILLLLPCFTN
jgi:hypothetical protein